ncbi:GGDEF domain-containing protein [Glaciecola sp. SC05]|uniref:GGDEF domain-containing protein n=1 Tax=Glaciecola sp. SC05 TaxID=1987355 RepID=UPI0035290C57
MVIDVTFNTTKISKTLAISGRFNNRQLAQSIGYPIVDVHFWSDIIKHQQSTDSRSSDYIVLVVISGGITLGLLPFAVLRILQQDWSIAIMNSAVFAATLLLFLHLLITKRVEVARVGLAVITLFAMTATIYLKGAQNVLWVYPALTTSFFLLSPSIAAIITLLFLFLVIGMIWTQVSFLLLLTFSISAGATFLFSFAFSKRMRTQALFLKQLATIDPLTGAGNRRRLEEKLIEIVNRIKRTPENVCSLIIFDIDYFKRVNDSFGHACGDEVLRQFSALMMDHVRESDSFYRLGGEEFVLVLENTQLFEAKKLAKKLAAAIEQTQWHLPELTITTSAGIAQYTEAESNYDWLQRADEALYRAKSNGRNQCFTSLDLSSAS